MATKITTADIETYLEGLGKHDSKGKILFERILFDIKKSKTGLEIVLDSPDTEKLLKNFKSEMIKTLMGTFKGSMQKEEKLVPRIGKVLRLKYVDKGTKYIDFDVKEYPTKGKAGAMPPKISEPATMLVLNAALETKGKVFKTEDDIIVHDVYKDLEKLFAPQWSHKLDEWIYTFFHQNKLFFANYSRSTWAPFKHKDYNNQRDPQVFFKEHLKTLEKAPGVTAGTYEQWNPADLYAVKRTEQSSLEKEIEVASKSPNANTLMKLNTHLIKLMEKKELVGISLKKIESGDVPKFKIYNVESSKLLTNLKAFSELEMFKMKDIHFQLRNVFGNFPGKDGVAATTYALFGSKVTSSAKFKISITRSANAISWNTSIPSAKGAQGGQSPKNDVLTLLRGGKATGVTFENKFVDYPKTAEKWQEIIDDPKSADHKLYKKWFNFVYKHPKNDYKNGMTFDKWTSNILEAYESRIKNGIGINGVTKLALLNFWYDALKYHSDDPEFWTDILYFGMKITSKGQFAPHAKIS